MDKKLLIILILLACSLTALIGQEEENETFYSPNRDVIVTRFDSGLPENGVNDTLIPVVLTDEEYIFKTYIMDKLLKSNRILY